VIRYLFDAVQYEWPQKGIPTHDKVIMTIHMSTQSSLSGNF